MIKYFIYFLNVIKARSNINITTGLEYDTHYFKWKLVIQFHKRLHFTQGRNPVILTFKCTYNERSQYCINYQDFKIELLNRKIQYSKNLLNTSIQPVLKITFNFTNMVIQREKYKRK